MGKKTGAANFIRLFLAILIPLLAFVLQWVFWPVIQPYVWFLFYPAVFLSSWIGGLIGGLAATIISALLVGYYFIIPSFSFALEKPSMGLTMGVFMTMGILFSLLHERNHKAKRQVAEALAAGREANELLRLFIEHAPAAIAMFDTNMFYLATSGRWRSYYCLDQTRSPIGRSHYEVNYNIPERWKEVHRRALKGEVIRAEEDFYQLLDGREQWVRWEVRPWHTATDKIGGILIFAEDITEIKRSEQALRESEKRLRLMLEAARIGAFDWNPQTDVSVWTPELEAMHGLAPGEFSRTYPTWKQLVHPCDLDSILAKTEETLATGASVEHKWRVVWPDSSVHWLAGRFQAFMDAAGKPLRVAGMCIDITEHKAAETALRENEDALRDSERRFRQVVESLPQLVWTCTPEGPCDYLSPQWVAYTGIPESAQLGYAWLEQLHPDDRPRTLELWQLASRRGDSFAVEFRIRRHDGVYRWFKTLAIPLRDEAGRIIKWFGSNTDIDARKHAEEALCESEERFRLAWNATRDVIWDWDIVYDSQRWSEASAEVFGWRDAIDMPQTASWWLDRVHSDDRLRITADFHAVLEDPARDHWEGEYRFQRRDGDYANVLDRRFVIRDNQGKPVRMIGAMQDITDRKRAELALQEANQRLRELAGALQDAEEAERKHFARELHDDLGQHLLALRMDLVGLAGRIEQESPASLSVKLHDMEKLLNATVQSVRRIISDLRPAILDDLGLSAALEWLVEDFIQRSGISCHAEIEEDDMDIDDRHATAVFRIAQEALTNIWRHAGATQARLSFKAHDHSLALTIEDNGKGISDQAQQKLQSFGLRGMRERVSLFGGTLAVIRNAEAGTRVEIALPLSEKANRAEEDSIHD
jgi:PAS domain S-box-containing protein